MKKSSRFIKIITLLTAVMLCLLPAVSLANEAIADLRIIKSASFGYLSGSIVAKNFTAIDGAQMTYSVNGEDKGNFDSDSFSLNISGAQIGDKFEITVVANAEGYAQEVISTLYTVSVRDYALIHNLTDYYILAVSVQADALTCAFRESVVHSSGNYYFFSTSSVTATLAANEPYRISGVSVDSGSSAIIPGDSPIVSVSFLEGVTGASCVYTLTVDVIIPDADYDPDAKETYIIRAAAGPGGKILMSGDVKVTQGTNPAFIMMPSEGYAVDCVYVDNLPKGAIGHYAFWDVSAAHNIFVTFVEAGDAVSPDAVFSVPASAPSIPRTGVGVSSATYALIAAGLALASFARKKQR